MIIAAAIQGNKAIIKTELYKQVVLQNAKVVLKRFGRALWKVIRGDLWVTRLNRYLRLEYKLEIAQLFDEIVEKVHKLLKSLLPNGGHFNFACRFFKVALSWQ